MGAAESSHGGALRFGDSYSIEGSCWASVRNCSYGTAGRNTQGTLLTADQNYKQLADKAMKELRRVRHPDIVTVLMHKAVPVDSMLTEAVQPLQQILHTLSSQELETGLGAVASALKFLHKTASIVHNNVGINSVFVRHDGTFALSGFEFATRDSEPVTAMPAYCQLPYYKVVAKEKDGKKRDVFLYSQFVKAVAEKLDATKVDRHRMLEFSEEIGNINAEDRPSMAEVCEHPFLRCALAVIKDQLLHMSVMSPEEKEHFFANLVDRLRSLDERVVAQFLSKSLIARCIMMEPLAHDHLYPALLKPKGENLEEGEDESILSSQVFKQFLIPELAYIWRVRDVTIRCALIRHLEQYAHLFAREVLLDLIIPELHTGTNDVNVDLVVESYKGLGTVARIVGVEAVNGSQPQKIFTDGTPKILSRLNMASSPVPWQSPALTRDNSEISLPRTTAKSQEISGSEFPEAPKFYLNTLERTPVSSAQQATCSHDGEHFDEDNKDAWDDWGDAGTSEADHDTELTSTASAVSSSVNNSIDVPSPKRPAVPNNHNHLKKLNSTGVTILDVKDMKVTVEDDFFAGMEPEIKTEGTIIEQLMKQKEREKEEERKQMLTPQTKLDCAPDIINPFACSDEAVTSEGGAWETDLSLDAYNGIEED